MKSGNGIMGEKQDRQEYGIYFVVIFTYLCYASPVLVKHE